MNPALYGGVQLRRSGIFVETNPSKKNCQPRWGDIGMMMPLLRSWKMFRFQNYKDAAPLGLERRPFESASTATVFTPSPA